MSSNKKTAKPNQAKHKASPQPSPAATLSSSKYLAPEVLLPVLFTLGVIVLLPCLSGDLLYTAQSYSLFMTGSQYLQECMHSAAGALQWAGCALTSLCYYPWLGALALLLLWLATWWMLRRVFPLPSRWQWLHFVPLVAMLTSILVLGYWVYYHKQPGYLFRHSLGLFAVVQLLQWRHRRWGWVMSFVTICFYPILGWYSVLALSLRLLRCLFYRQWANGIIAGLCVLAGPAALSLLYTNLRSADAWTAGFPTLANNTCSSTLLVLPHYLCMAALVTLVVLSWHFRPSQPNPDEVATEANLPKRVYTNVFMMLVMLVGAYLCRPSDYNLYSEMRIIRQLENWHFAEVLKEVDEAPNGPTRQMIGAKNVALLHTGHLHDLVFSFPNMGPEPIHSDGLEVHQAHTAGTLYFLYHGMSNNATHWCIENSVERGLTVYTLRVLSLSAILSGESALAGKYLGMLGLAPFQQSFVRRYYPLTIHPDWISDYPELTLMKELHDNRLEDTYGDDSNVEWTIYNEFSDQLVYESEKSIETALIYAMLRKNADLFWIHLINYSQRHKGKIPLKVQEATLFFASVPNATYPASSFRFDPTVTTRFQQYHQTLSNLRRSGLSEAEMGQRLKPQFGDTYWWFNNFCVNVQAY